MLTTIRCPKHHEVLVFYKDTPTHKLFKCPICDYVEFPGVVHDDLPEKYINLQAENKLLRDALEIAIDSLKAYRRYPRLEVDFTLRKIDKVLEGK